LFGSHVESLAFFLNTSSYCRKLISDQKRFSSYTVYCASKVFRVSFDFLLKASKTIITSRRG